MDADLKQYLDDQFKTVAHNQDRQTEILKYYADEQTEKLAAIIAETIADPMKEGFAELKDYGAIRDEVSTLKTDMQKIKTALRLN